MAFKRLCTHSALYGANIPASEYLDAGIRFLRTTDINEDGDLNPGGVFLPESLAASYLLKDGDILISRSGTVGRSFVYKSDLHGPCCYAGYLVRYSLSHKANEDYVITFTKSCIFCDFIKLAAVVSTIENVNGEKFANMPFLAPPIEEQTAIVKRIKQEALPIEKAISRTAREIDLIREYRARLISDVVTGQVDIRQIAVPEIAGEDLAPLEEDDADAEDLLDETLETEDAA